MAIKSVYHQHRTTDQIYLFQIKDPTTISLKIYNISGKRLFKTALETDLSTIQSLFTASHVKPLLDLFEQKKLLPPSPFASQPLQDALKELDNPTLPKETGAAIPIALATAALFYQYILRCDPTQWQIYTTLSDLLPHPQEKAHLLLTGACHAIENNEHIIAEKLCLQAEKASPNPFQLGPILTRLQQIDPLMQHIDTTQKVHLLTQKSLHQLSKEFKKSNNLVSQLSMTLDKTSRELDTTRAELAALQKELSHLNNPPPIAFGKAKWATHFGDVGAEPPLPPDIHQILQSPCPFWPGKKVEETHLLVLIPKSVNGQPFTLKLLGELAENTRQGPATKYSHFDLGEYRDQPINQSSYWILMTRDVIEGSRRQTDARQKQLITTYAQKTGLPYKFPKILEAAACLILHHVSTGQKLYSDIPATYMRCREFYYKQGRYILAAGNFGADGLYIGHHITAYQSVGVGCRRKL